MKRAFLHNVVVVASLLVGVGHAESLNFAQSTTYASPVYGNAPISHGLYVRGCGIYTSNDWGGSPGAGIPMAALKHSNLVSFNAQSGSIVNVGVSSPDGILAFQQRILVEDWFGTGSSAINSYLFNGVGGGAVTQIMKTYRIKDDPSCVVLTKTDDTYLSGVWQSSYTTYKDTIYVSGVEGLQVLAFNPTTGATSGVMSSSGRAVIGAWRLGNRIYEAAGYGSDSQNDTAVIVIRNATTLSSVDSLVLTGLLFLGDADGGGGFKVVKDSFIVDAQKRVRTIGALAHMNDLFLFDLSNDSISFLFSSRDSSTQNPFENRIVCDIAVLDRKLFALTLPYDSNTLTSEYRIDVWDISNPEEPLFLAGRSTNVATTEGDDGMDTVYARRDSLGDPIQNTTFYSNYRNRIQVVRNRQIESGSSGFWKTEGSYSIFSNMQATSEAGFPGAGGFPFVHQILYTPSALDTFRIGNVNGSSGASINVQDVTTLTAYLNDTTNTVVVHRPLSRYDVNCDGYINWADLRALNWYMFYSGQKPGRICKNCF